MESGKKRAIKIWHRRSGKDKTDLNFCISRMFPEYPGGRIGTYFHLFPTYAQGKKIIWDTYDRDGFKVTDHFPNELMHQLPAAAMRHEHIGIVLNRERTGERKGWVGGHGEC